MKTISDGNFVLIYLFSISIATILISTNVEIIETNTAVSEDSLEKSILKKQYPINCSSSSKLDEDWSCEKLYDGKYTTWEDKSLACKDGWLEFTFSKEIYLEFIVIENPEDNERFFRSHLIRDINITTSDVGFTLTKELENDNISQWIDINATTSYFKIDILSAYPGEEINEKVPFDECAIQEITFYGRDI